MPSGSDGAAPNGAGAGPSEGDAEAQPIGRTGAVAEVGAERIPSSRVGEAARRGRYWGADYAFALRTIRRGLTRRDVPETFADGNRQPVLLLPGVLEEWTMMRAIAERLSGVGHPIHVLPALRRNTVSVIEAASLASAFLETHECEGLVVVAHSKGGLIGKKMLLDDVDGRIVRMVTVATPFAGSPLAHLLPVPIVRALRPSDPTILALAARPEVNGRIVSIYPSFDPHIPGGSELEGAINVQVAAMGHFRILEDLEVLDAVEAAVREAPSR